MGKIGIIGGSGLYKMEGLTNVKTVAVLTPFGKPSGKLVTGSLEGREVVFLPRHDVGHRIPPGLINYRANIFAMKKLGVDRLISVSACGSLKEILKPLDFVIVDQFVDRTNSGRQMSFFNDEGLVAHIGFAHPVCEGLAGTLYKSCKELNIRAHHGGTYINMEGPAFSTLAESKLYRSWDMDIIGMTNCAEARLAREAEMCYATLAAITDYDCWYEAAESVSVEMVIQNLMKNVDNSKKIIRSVVKSLPEQDDCSCRHALKDAIVTDRKCIPAKLKKDLKLLIGKYIK